MPPRKIGAGDLTSAPAAPKAPEAPKAPTVIVAPPSPSPTPPHVPSPHLQSGGGFPAEMLLPPDPRDPTPPAVEDDREQGALDDSLDRARAHGIVVRGRFGAVLKALSDVDVGAEHPDLHATLDQIVNPEDPKLVRHALEGAARITYRAFRVYLLARRERREVELAAEGDMARWNEEALNYFADQKAEEKAEGTKGAGTKIAKRVDKSMIADYARITRPKAWRANELAVQDSKNIEALLEGLYRQLRERGYNLRTLAGGKEHGDDEWGEASRQSGRGGRDQ